MTGARPAQGWGSGSTCAGCAMPAPSLPQKPERTLLWGPAAQGPDPALQAPRTLSHKPVRPPAEPGFGGAASKQPLHSVCTLSTTHNLSNFSTSQDTTQADNQTQPNKAEDKIKDRVPSSP